MSTPLQVFNVQDLVGGIIVYQAPEFKFKVDTLESSLIKTGTHNDEIIIEKLGYRSSLPLGNFNTDFKTHFKPLISIWSSVHFLDYTGHCDKVYLTPLGRSAVFEELKKYEPESLLHLWKIAPIVWAVYTINREENIFRSKD